MNQRNANADRCGDGCVYHRHVLGDAVSKRRGNILEKFARFFPARQRVPDLANTPEFAKAQRQRKKVEALFAEPKNQIGLRHRRLRRMRFVREQFYLAATLQNLKRLLRFLSFKPAPGDRTRLNVG